VKKLIKYSGTQNPGVLFSFTYLQLQLN